MFDTFVHQFYRRMLSKPDHMALLCISDDGTERRVSRAELLLASQSCAENLRANGVLVGDKLVLVLPHGMDLFSAIWGVLLLGAIPTVYTYPDIAGDAGDYLEKLTEFAANIRADSIVSTAELMSQQANVTKESGLNFIALNSERLASCEVDIQPQQVDSLEQAAVLQFSSGTTGMKKGVVISYRAIENYLVANQASMRLVPEDVFLSWLPLNHDMGLIACFIVPLTAGIPVVLMSARHWISRPVVLFQAAHRYRATISLMPNFAFSYCVKRVPERELEGLDLSSWRMLINGAEPVRAQDLKDFAEHFSTFGLKPEALRVAYGLAECVLGVARTAYGQRPHVDWVNGPCLLEENKAMPCAQSAPHARSIVSCGIPHAMVQIEIAGPSGASLPEREVGEIRIKSTTLFNGYHLQPDLTTEALKEGWFYTGDLGYLCSGELYVCGRKKDLIISFGRNIYPHDLEAIAETYPGVSKGRTVAFGVIDAKRGTEKIVLLVELHQGVNESSVPKLLNDIREGVWQQMAVTISHAQVVSRGWVVKTTSGKLSRHANRQKYLASQVQGAALEPGSKLMLHG